MFPYSLWLLMIAVVMLTALAPQQSKLTLPDGTTYNRDIGNPVCVVIAILLLAFFTGRTIANDVFIYRLHFANINTDITWAQLYETGTGSNPLFGFIQVLFKRLVSANPADFHLFEGFIVQTCFVLFYRRYSPSLSMSLFMVIASGLFYFLMVSWKQSIAMGIGLAGIPLIQQKRYVLYGLLLAVTMLIHPYIIMYGMLPFLINDKVWTKKNILMIGFMCLAGFSLSKILGSALEVTEIIFDNSYDAQWFTEDNGVSYQRIIFFAITPALSWIYRKELDANPYPLMNGFIQMSVISFGFYLMSMSGGANFISRMGTYFEPFSFVALPYILLYIVPEDRRTVTKYLTLGLFLIFFCFLQLKRGSIF